MARPLTTLLAVLLALTFIAAGCGDDEQDSGDSTSESASEGLTKPKVEVPAGEPPKQLEVTDITEGDGTKARTGDLVTVQYVGVNYSNGEEFGSSWDTGEPFIYQLGTDGAISGWNQGIPGMKIGGRRELVIPPALAYGKPDSPPADGPSGTLVFVVDLVDVQ